MKEKTYTKISTELYMSLKKQIDSQVKQIAALEEKVNRLEYTNELLYKDNSRLSKIVDSLLWGVKMFKLFYYKYIKRQCPHSCLLCKYRKNKWCNFYKGMRFLADELEEIYKSK